MKRYIVLDEAFDEQVVKTQAVIRETIDFLNAENKKLEQRYLERFGVPFVPSVPDENVPHHAEKVRPVI